MKRLKVDPVRHREWKAAEPVITREDRKRLRGFTPTLKPGVLDVRMALWEMRRK